MTFVGVMQGSVGVVVLPEMCLEVAANMLGVDPDDEEAMDKGRDALKELLNITCGHLLTNIAGEEPVFDLTVPEVTELSAERWQELKAQAGYRRVPCRRRPGAALVRGVRGSGSLTNPGPQSQRVGADAAAAGWL